MNQDNRAFLDNNRKYVLSYQQKDPPLRMSYKDRQRLLEIVKGEFDSGVSADLWCPACVSAFVINAYILYDQYLANENSKPGK